MRQVTVLVSVLSYAVAVSVAGCRRAEQRAPASAGAPVLMALPAPAVATSASAVSAVSVATGIGTPAMPGKRACHQGRHRGLPQRVAQSRDLQLGSSECGRARRSGASGLHVRPADLKDRGKDAASQDLVWQGDFSALEKPGRYTIEVGSAQSDPFTIGRHLYQSALELGLKHFYFQRCRTVLEKPYAEYEGKAYTRSAHADDGWDYATYPEKKRKWQLVAGWHDAGNFDMYIPSTGPAAQAPLIAYEAHPALFSDATNIPESHNQIPDILDEVRWGLSWILSMQELDTGAFRAREAVYDWSDPDP